MANDGASDQFMSVKLKECEMQLKWCKQPQKCDALML